MRNRLDIQYRRVGRSGKGLDGGGLGSWRSGVAELAATLAGDCDKLGVGYWITCGANLVPKPPRARRTNGDDFHRFFESFLSVSLRSCWLVFT